MNKKLMEILEKLANNCYNEGRGTKDTTIAKELTQAHDQIMELWKERLPPERISTDIFSPKMSKVKEKRFEVVVNNYEYQHYLEIMADDLGGF